MSHHNPSTPETSILGLEQGAGEKIPVMSGWNGCLRFCLEIASMIGIGHFGYNIGDPVNWLRLLLTIVIPLAAVIVWGTFNVPNDPSRSGAAPIPVIGVVRLGVELSILGFGGFALGIWNSIVGWIYGALGVLHYVSYRERVYWLWNQKR